MPYLTEDAYAERFIGKTIKAIRSTIPGRVVFTFTDDTHLTLDAAVEHERVQRNVNIIANALELS
jgi:hypothetical protein